MHNKNLLKPNPNIENPRLCNCRVKADCPLDGKCLTKSIIYQASVTTNNNEPTQHYIGLTDTTFKIRYNNHTSSFRNISKKHATELSKHIWHLKENNITTWHLKENNINYSNIKRQTIRRANSYNTTTGTCNLCLWEKFYIIQKPHMATLNKRNELVST